MATKPKTLDQPTTRPSSPCSVDFPVHDDCCVSPCDPPWLPDKQCFVWYEVRSLTVPIKVDRTSEFSVAANVEFRITYAHRLCLIGKQHGPLLFTITLLPGEKVTLYHSERYRQITSVQDRYSVQTTFAQFTSMVHQARVTDTRGTLSDKLSNTSGSVSGGAGIDLGFISAGAKGGFSSSTTDHNVVQTGHVSDQFDQSVTQASFLTHAERSVVVSLYNEKDSLDVSARTVQNDNACRAVTYFVRKIVELYTLSTEVVAIDFRVLASGVPSDFHSLNDLGSLPSVIVSQIKDALKMLPKVGDTVAASRPISVPTDGMVYDPELAHCCSCEPQREAAMEIQLEKQKAEALKACLEAQLLELELKRRSKLLEQGQLMPFDGAQAPAPAPTPPP